MRCFIALIAALFCFSSFKAVAQKRISVKPEESGTVEWRHAPEEENHGLLPLPYSFNYSEYYKHVKDAAKDLPAAYDLRTAGPGGAPLVSAVKGQLGCGACWAFATYGSIESYLMTLGMGEYDFSENNLKNCSGFDPLPCQWGHHFMSTAYLMRRSGPIYEADDPYIPQNDPCTPGFTPAFHFTDARYPPDDLLAIKEAIFTFGGIYTTMSFKLAYYNPVDFTYCDTVSTLTGHAVTLVGWDDNKFVTGGPSSPPGGRTGAFIAKNSRGITFGEAGFFYVAYDDNLIKKYCAFWPGFSAYDSTQYIYQYDTIGGWPFVGYEDPVAFGITKYTAPETHLLFAAGTYTVSYGTTLDIFVYESFDGNTPSGLAGSVENHYCEMPGFHSVTLPDPIRIEEGENFYIMIRYSSPGEDYPIAVEGVDPGYSSPVLETDKCWVSADGLGWEACGDGTQNEFDLCMKVYAYEPFELNVKVFLEGPFDGLEMGNALNTAGYLPLQQPFNVAPWYYSGNESVAIIPSPDIVDWALIELRETIAGASSATSGTRIARTAGFLLKDGHITAPDGASTPVIDAVVRNNLYIVIHHRNHLSVMASTPAVKINNVFGYDFSSGFSQAYGGQAGYKQLTGSVYGMAGGDGSADGQVNNADKNDIWAPTAGQSGYMAGDFDMDGQVANSDKNDIWAPNSGLGTQVPQ